MTHAMPYIEIGDDCSIYCYEATKACRRMSQLAIDRRWWEGARIYSDDGTYLSAQPVPPIAPTSLLKKIAGAFYNPIRNVEFEYNPAGSYQLDELKARVADCVDKDDDILTQRMEPKEIKARLAKARSFHDVYFLLRRMGIADDG